MAKHGSYLGTASKTLKGRHATAVKGFPRKGSSLPYCPISKPHKPGFGSGRHVKGLGGMSYGGYGGMSY